MDAKKLILLVGALFTAAITAVLAKHMAGTGSMPQVSAAVAPQPTGPQVLVATKPLPVGTILGPGDVKFQPWPRELVDGAYFVRGGAGVDPSKMQGMVVRNAITVGQPVTQGALVSPGDRGFLAAALTPGMRAVTVSVSAEAGVAGFIFPGDRVDVLLSQEVPAGQDGGQPLRAAETIARNMRVLATDQRTSNAPDADGKQPEVKTFNSVTLEATPKLAEKIAVAQKIGALSMSLRPLADNTQELEKAIASGDIDVPAGADPKAESKMLLDLASQPQDTNITATVGGDVSRFQRSSVPSQHAAAAMGLPRAPGAGVQTAAAVPIGPAIRVSRGANMKLEPVGGK